MKYAYLLIATLLSVIILLVLGYFVWPTPYRYDHINLHGTVRPVRQSRFSGEAEILYLSGWRLAGNNDSKSIQSVELPVDEVAKLSGNAEFVGESLYCHIYNGSAYQINEVVVHITVRNPIDLLDPRPEDSKTLVSRDYRLTNAYPTKSLTTGLFNQDVGFSPVQGQVWTWAVQSAKGTSP
ncbi:MAG: hypothetical protein ACYC26_13115 [Phycisphaerales bacterium]